MKRKTAPIKETEETPIPSVSVHIRLRGDQAKERYRRLAIHALNQGKRVTSYAEEILTAAIDKLPKV